MDQVSTLVYESPKKNHEKLASGHHIHEPLIQSAQNDILEIELLDILKFLWRARIYLSSGAIVGLFASLIATHFYYVPIAQRQFEISLDSKSLPAIEDPKIIVTEVLSLLSKPSHSALFWQKLTEVSPQLGVRFDKKSISIDGLVQKQLYADKASETPIVFGQPSSSSNPNPQTFEIFLRMPAKILEEVSTADVIQSFNTVITKKNQSFWDLNSNLAKKSFEEAILKVNNPNEELAQLTLRAEQQQLKLLQEISQIEQLLIVKSKGLNSQFQLNEALNPQYNLFRTMLLALAKSEKSKQLNWTLNTENISLKNERILQLSSLLLASGRQTQTDTDLLNERLAKINTLLQKEQNVLLGLSAIQNSLSQNVSDAAKKVISPINKETQFLPLFLISARQENPSRREAEKIISTSRYAFLFLGIVLGGILGLFFLVFKQFFSSNTYRPWKS